MSYVFKDGFAVAWLDASGREVPMQTPIPAYLLVD